jgi:hypothetical protein
MEYNGMDYEVAESESTPVVYERHHEEADTGTSTRMLQAPEEPIAAYHAAEAPGCNIGRPTSTAAVTAEDVLEAAMEGYDADGNHQSNPLKRRLEEETSVSQQDPNKRPRTAEMIFNAPKKVNNEQWDTMFERLKAYKAQHGDCLVPKRYTADPKLGTWVETQVSSFKIRSSSSPINLFLLSFSPSII